MYTYEENGKRVNGITDAEFYNITDDISKLWQTYSVSCHDQIVVHTKKAYRGFLATLGVALVGGLYTLIHHGAAQYYSGAEDVYRKYANLVEDADTFEAEWRDMDSNTRSNISRFKK